MQCAKNNVGVIQLILDKINLLSLKCCEVLLQILHSDTRIFKITSLKLYPFLMKMSNCTVFKTIYFMTIDQIYIIIKRIPS